jgi:hypothetical protein
MDFLPWASFQGPENNAFDLYSRFLVASRPVPDLLLSAKHLFIAARTVWRGPAMPVGLIAFACFDLGDGGLEQPGALGVGEHGVDDAMLAGIELARTKIASMPTRTPCGRVM